MCRLDGPTLRYFEAFNFDLSSDHLIPDFLPCSPVVGSPSLHTFEGNNAHSKVVGHNRVWFAQHDFWGHVARCPTRIKRVVRGHLPRNAEVSQSQVALIVKYHILRFDVPMNDAP